MVKRLIRKSGGSLAISIPVVFIEELKLAPHQLMNVERLGVGLMLTPISKQTAGGDAVDSGREDAG